MIYEDPFLAAYYKDYLQEVSPGATLRSLPRKGGLFQGLLLAPDYCEKFAFTSQFIGTSGKYIKQIREECRG